MTDSTPMSGSERYEQWAKLQGLEWVGGRENIEALVRPRFWSDEVVADHNHLFQHVRAFARRSRARKPDVVALLMFPYIDDSLELRDVVEELAVRFGVNGRVNHESDRIYRAESYTAIALWADEKVTLR